MASRSLGTLTLDLVAKTGGFVQGMSQAERAASKAGDSMAKQATKIGKAFAAFSVAAATGIAYFTKNTIDAQNQLYDLSQSTGISTESLSAFKYAADLSGTSLEQVAQGFKKLASSAADAARGVAEPGKAFATLGVEVKNADGTLKDSEELLLEVADAFASYEDGAAKSALATDIFGKAGAALIPFLNEGREGLEDFREEMQLFNLEVSTASAQASEDFLENIQKIGKVSDGLSNALTTTMLPALAEFSEILLDDIKAGLEDSGDAIIAWGEAITHAIAIVLDSFHAGSATIKTAFTVLGEGLGSSAAALVQRLKGNSEEADAIVIDSARRVVEALEGLAEDPAFGKYQRAWEDMRDGVSSVLREIDLSRLPKKKLTFFDEGAAEKLKAEAATALGSIQSLVTGLETQIATYEQGAPAVIAYRIAHGDLAASFTAAGAAAEPLKSELIALTEQYESLQEKSKAATEWQTENAAMAADAAAVYEATRTPLEQFNATIEELNRQRTTIDPATNAPFLDPETYRRAAEAAQDAFEAATNEVSEFHKRATENIQDIFAEHLRTGFEEGFDGILDSFKQLIVDMLAEAIAADFASALFGKGGLGSGGGLFGFIGDLFGGGRASGGPVTAGTSYVVGERGAEVFTPRSSGFITPAGSAAATAGAVSITQNNYISGSNLGPEQMTRILEENNKKLKGEFLQELRRGAYQ